MSFYVPLDDARASLLLGQLADRLRAFPGELQKSQIASLNRVGATLNKEALKVLTARYTAKRADIQRKMRLDKASGGRLMVSLRGEGRPIHLGLWPNSQAVVRKGKHKYRGARVKILKASGRKLVKGGFGGVSSKNQHSLIFKREGKARYPVKGLYGPSMIGWLTRSEHQEPLMTLARTRLELELRRDAAYRLSKLGV